MLIAAGVLGFLICTVVGANKLEAGKYGDTYFIGTVGFGWLITMIALHFELKRK
jgi:hypothetical protein